MEKRKTVMLMRMGCVVLLMGMAVAGVGQTAPILQKLSGADTKINGTAQGMTSDYSAVLIYVCTSDKQPEPGAECSGVNVQDTGAVMKLALVNLIGAPFVVTAPDGKFTVTMVNPLAAGAYVWVTQVTLESSTKRPVIKTSDVVRVRVSLIEAASLSLSGTDSASKDIGGKAGLDIVHGLAREGLGQTRLFLTANYDDKWKHTPLSSNVSQMFSGELDQFRQFHPGAYLGPFAMAYRNNTQGVRVEQTYGFGVEKDFSLGAGNGLALGVWPAAVLENLYAPGQSVNLFGVKLRADLLQPIGKTGSVVTKLTYTPALNQTHDWSATGLWSLNMPLNQHWSVTFTVADNYYEIAPRTFNKNYLLPSIGVTFK
jgi:hypothetical protein